MDERTQGKWIAYVENLGHGHYGKIKLVTQKHLDENLPAIGEIKSPHDANYIVLAVNAHADLLAACEEVSVMCLGEPMNVGTLAKVKAAIAKATT